MDEEQRILQLFKDGDRALMSANVNELRRIYADDYIQHDERGNASSRQRLIRNLTSGAIRFLSLTSTGRSIRLLRDDIAIVHGSEDDEIERAGECLHVSYVYTDVVIKRSGNWHIVDSQLVKLTKP
jgi:ketosteroid isomerase-like protein